MHQCAELQKGALYKENSGQIIHEPPEYAIRRRQLNVQTAAHRNLAILSTRKKVPRALGILIYIKYV